MVTANRAEQWHGAMVPSKFEKLPSVAIVTDEQTSLPLLVVNAQGQQLVRVRSCPEHPERSAARLVVTWDFKNAIKQW